MIIIVVYIVEIISKECLTIYMIAKEDSFIEFIIIEVIEIQCMLSEGIVTNSFQFKLCLSVLSKQYEYSIFSHDHSIG